MEYFWDELEGLDHFYEKEMIPDMDKKASKHIQDFFHDKDMHCGGSIPQKLLFTDKHIKMVSNTPVTRGINIAFKSIDAFYDRPKFEVNDGTVTEDMKMIIAILDHASERRIPKSYSAGIMLMYLKLCCGIPIYELSPEEIAMEQLELEPDPVDVDDETLKELEQELEKEFAEEWDADSITV